MARYVSYEVGGWLYLLSKRGRKPVISPSQGMINGLYLCKNVMAIRTNIVETFPVYTSKIHEWRTLHLNHHPFN